MKKRPRGRSQKNFKSDNRSNEKRSDGGSSQPQRSKFQFKASYRMRDEEKNNGSSGGDRKGRGHGFGDQKVIEDRRKLKDRRTSPPRKGTFTPPGGGRNFIRPSSEGGLVDGIVKRHPDGFGFLVPDRMDHPDVYISRQHMIGIMSSDRVKAKVHKENDGDRFRGEVVEVLSRAVKQVMGVFRSKDSGGGFLKDEESNWGADLQIPGEKTLNAKDGSLVVANVIRYPDERGVFLGEVVEVLPGEKADPLYDTRKVIYAHRIPTVFSKAALDEAHNLPTEVTPDQFAGRKDLRSLAFITIDGATAKDFDDAVYVETHPRGFKCYVAIADVSHYVKPGSAIDKDAYERGTSTYFPHYVVPMLPEELSNELCSLKPHVPRLALVAEMDIDFSGVTYASQFYEAVIQSHERVTYGEAQEVIDKATPNKLLNVADAILRAADLAKVLMARRFREGSLDLEIPETQVLLNEAGVPIDIIKSERLFAHRLIEELMLAANVAVARFFGEKEIPAIYRVHEEPAGDNIETLGRFLTVFGGNKSLQGGQLQKRISKALEEFSGKPQAEILNILTLRSMKQAKYSPDNVGHFGLGFGDYTHFTSPIRRYPDLIVHRLVKSLIIPNSSYRPMSEDDLATAGAHLSACEQRSAKAERQFHSIKRARFMTPHLGEVFEGIISSVTRFGVFVLLRTYDVDGLVKIENLGNDQFEFDEESLRLVGKRSGFSYNLGDPITIQVAATDPEQGRIEFILAGEPELGSTQNRKTNRPNDQKRRKAPHDRGSVRKSRVSKRRRKG